VNRSLLLLCIIPLIVYGQNVNIASSDQSKLINYKAISDSCFSKGMELYHQREYEKAISSFEASADYLERLNLNNNYYGYEGMWISSCYYKIGNEVEANKINGFYKMEPPDKFRYRTIDSLYIIAEDMLLNRNIDKAASLVDSCIDFTNKNRTGADVWLAAHLYRFSQLCLEKNYDKESIRYGDIALHIQKKYLDNRCRLVIQSYTNIFTAYESLGDYCNAIKYGKELVTLVKDNELIEETLYPTILARLCCCIAEEKDSLKSSKVVQLTDEVVQCAASLRHFYKNDYSSIYVSLIQANETIRDFDRAEKLCNEVLPILRAYFRTSEKMTDDYLFVLDCLQAYHRDRYEYSQQKCIIEEQKGISKKDGSLRWYHKSLSNMVECNIKLGNYDGALNSFNEFKDYVSSPEFISNTMKESPPSSITSFWRLAWYYHLFGNNSAAYTICEISLKLSLSYYGALNRTTLLVVRDFIGYAELLGYENDAKACCIEVLRKMFDSGKFEEYKLKHGDVISSIYSYLAKIEKEKTKATKWIGTAYHTAAKYYGETSATTLEYLFDAGEYAYQDGKIADGIALMKSAVNQMEELGIDIPFNNKVSYANLFCDLGEYDKGVKVVRDYLEKNRRLPLNRCLDAQVYLSFLYLQSKTDTINWLGLVKRIDKLQKDWTLGLRYSYLSKELSHTLQSSRYYIWHNGVLPKLAYYLKNDTINGYLYNSKLQNNGLQVKWQKEMRDIALQGNDTIQSNYFGLILKRNMLNKLSEDYYNNDYSDKMFSLQDSIREVERELLAYSRNHIAISDSITWENVRNGIADNDIAIEFVVIPDSVEVIVAALLLKSNYSFPKLVPLFTKTQLRNAYIEDEIKDSLWYVFIWKPIQSELEGVKRIFFSPSGMIYTLGIEYLPTPSNELMSDKYEIYRLSSTAEISKKNCSDVKYDMAMLYGGLDYNAKDTNDTSPISDINLYNLAFFSGSSPMQRSLGDFLKARGGFEELANSYQEVAEIEKKLMKKGISTMLMSGIYGTEESLRKVDNQKVCIAHFATHGSYVNSDEAEQKRNENNFAFISSRDADSYFNEEDKALTRSFLVMSGGNRLLQRDSLLKEEDDGILTALEISQMDLHGLDLVVLSACETALGDISYEGVYGLQRGFKKAGANTILMSLDKVDDEATRILMVEFYKNLMAGKSKHQSLKDAQHHLRQVENGKYDNPKYWASFIMLDGLN